MDLMFILPYIVLVLYAAAVVLHFVMGRWIGIGIYTCGAVVNISLVFQRWSEAGHLPFSNMYETMLTLAAGIYVLFLITEWGLKVNAPWMDPLIAGMVFTPVAFEFFPREIQPLMPALQSPLFFPHVMSYILGYAAMAKACALAINTLAVKGPNTADRERATYRVVGLGFPLLTAGLLLGAVWAKLAWGDYWSWDPKEMWSLITWLTYLAYYHVRFRMGPRHRLVPWLAILGFGMVIITLLWVNLSRIFSGLHSYA